MTADAGVLGNDAESVDTVEHLAATGPAPSAVERVGHEIRAAGAGAAGVTAAGIEVAEPVHLARAAACESRTSPVDAGLTRRTGVATPAAVFGIVEGVSTGVTAAEPDSPVLGEAERNN
jgi:hypothetical protein